MLLVDVPSPAGFDAAPPPRTFPEPNGKAASIKPQLQRRILQRRRIPRTPLRTRPAPNLRCSSLLSATLSARLSHRHPQLVGKKDRAPKVLVDVPSPAGFDAAPLPRTFPGPGKAARPDTPSHHSTLEQHACLQARSPPRKDRRTPNAPAAVPIGAPSSDGFPNGAGAAAPEPPNGKAASIKDAFCSGGGSRDRAASSAAAPRARSAVSRPCRCAHLY
jgi:hypothetical protein